MKCGIYLRISKETDNESNSISGQRMVIKEFAGKHNDMEIAGEWCDDGYSGITFARVR